MSFLDCPAIQEGTLSVDQLVLKWISVNNRAELTVSLLEYMMDSLGADVEMKNEWGKTMLITAAGYGWSEGVRLLLYKYNANINAITPQGTSALLEAVQFNWRDSSVIQLLLSHPDINVDLCCRDLTFAVDASRTGFVNLVLPLITDKAHLQRLLTMLNKTVTSGVRRESQKCIRDRLRALKKRKTVN